MVEFSCAVVPVLHMYKPKKVRKKLNVRKYSFGTLSMYVHVHTTF
jgi:hypothetical protein